MTKTEIKELLTMVQNSKDLMLQNHGGVDSPTVKENLDTAYRALYAAVNALEVAYLEAE
jgi:hypothetical protein